MATRHSAAVKLAIQRRTIYLQPPQGMDLLWVSRHFQSEEIGAMFAYGDDVRSWHVRTAHHIGTMKIGVVRRAADRARLAFIVAVSPAPPRDWWEIMGAIPDHRYRDLYTALHSLDIMQHYLFDHMKVENVGMRVRLDNRASLALMRRGGLLEDHRATTDGLEHSVFMTNPTAWAQRRARLEAAEDTRPSDVGAAFRVLAGPPYEPVPVASGPVQIETPQAAQPDPDAVSSARVNVGGMNIHVAQMGEGPPVLLLHGWPEFWLSWRYVMPALARQGFRVVAADLRGCGGSDAPAEVAAYAMASLVRDGKGVLDALGLRNAVWVGHDWGALVAWHAALMTPQRVAAVAALNVPWTGRGLVRPTSAMRRAPDGRFNYVLQMLQHPDPEGDFMGRLPHVLRSFMTRAAFDPSFFTPELQAAWVAEYARSGLHSINLYRNLDANWEADRVLDGQPVSQPALVLLADDDPVLPPSTAVGMARHVPNARVVRLPRCGHWMAQEQPDAVLQHLLPFLDELRQRGANASGWLGVG